jgi:hypothetical protein
MDSKWIGNKLGMDQRWIRSDWKIVLKWINFGLMCKEVSPHIQQCHGQITF